MFQAKLFIFIALVVSVSAQLSGFLGTKITGGTGTKITGKTGTKTTTKGIDQCGGCDLGSVCRYLQSGSYECLPLQCINENDCPPGTECVKDGVVGQCLPTSCDCEFCEESCPPTECDCKYSGIPLSSPSFLSKAFR